MVIVDDILLFPVRGIFWIFREVCEAAQQEAAGEAEAIKTELMELYMMLETGRITEAEFAAREKDLLDKLEGLQEPNVGSDEEERQDAGDDQDPA
jgi:dihydrodipicolinate synthase/N-acetylneuraminate lyase